MIEFLSYSLRKVIIGSASKNVNVRYFQWETTAGILLKSPEVTLNSQLLPPLCFSFFVHPVSILSNYSVSTAHAATLTQRMINTKWGTHSLEEQRTPLSNNKKQFLYWKYNSSLDSLYQHFTNILGCPPAINIIQLKCHYGWGEKTCTKLTSHPTSLSTTSPAPMSFLWADFFVSCNRTLFFFFS